jgi:hypothetical protein
MAKHVIIEVVTFTPSTKTLVVTGKNIRQQQLLLITNTTTGTVIYNFSDPNLGGTVTNAVSTTTGQETTTIVLAYNTASMSSTDKIAVMVEESYQEIIPAETYMDPVSKQRVSTPQSLIDTDFEYGTQPTKWESLNTLNNRPSAFYDVTNPLVITNITASGRVVTVSTTTPPAVGTPIFVQGTLDIANADGWWIVDTVSAGTSFTYNTTNAPATSLYDQYKSYIWAGTFFTGAAIPAGTTAFTYSGTTITGTTTYAHGLRVGDGIYVTGTSGASSNPNGSWVIATTPTSNTFTFVCINNPTSGTITSVLNASLYPRSLGYVQQRAFDGGVQFSNLSPNHGYKVTRQTRRYFRYQSGKAIQFSTGTMLKPALNVDTITSSGTTVTVTCKFPHGLSTGTGIYVAGANETAYNGTGVVGGSTYVVTGVSSPLIFTYTASATPSASPATGFPITVAPNSWYGSSNRVGLFDDQNGMFFEFDGQTLYAVKRNSTQQISGVVAATLGSNSVTGTNTKFSSQLKPQDNIVIRGQSYLVQAITSDTQMYVYPEYRGVSITATQCSKTIDTRVAQANWNIDPCNGTGASLYNLDLTKMQMFYIDYSWYGAGAVRFGFKNNRGEVIYCHRSPNNNINTEAYMRSGNLPARYESNTLPPKTYLTATLSSGVTASVSVNDTSFFPSSGSLVISQAADTGAVIEYITYTGKTATTFTGLTRNAAGGTGSATTFTYSATAPINVELYSPTQASTISHWGSSVIMDGRFDDDKSFVFNQGMNTSLTNVPANQRVALMSLRLAPAVDNGLTGLLGVREIVNRMQLTLRGVDVITTGSPFKMELILNGRNTGGQFQSVGGSSLSQICYHSLSFALSSVVLDNSGNLTVPALAASVGSYSVGQPLTVSGSLSAGTINGTANYGTPTTFFIGQVVNSTTIKLSTTFANATAATPVTVSTTAGTATTGGTFTLNTSATYAGESIFGFFAASGGVTSQDLNSVRDLGTSILSGGTSLAVPYTATNLYPDGPDVVTLVATNIGNATNTINARLSWTEAQA